MIEIKCDYCKKICKKYSFSLRVYKNHFCSKKCHYSYQKENHNRYWLGKKRPEIIEKLRLANLGKKLSEEHKANIKKTNWMRGRCGKLHPRYNGGKARTSHMWKRKEYGEWREKIFKRDCYTCQLCNIEGGRLQAHHILTWKEYPKLRYRLYNGITFCELCHKGFHSRYGQRNNTKEQLKEYLKDKHYYI